MYFPKLDKIAWFLKKYETYFILLFLVIIGTILWKFNYLTEFTGEWTSCVDYIKEGILYKGQPRCYHGPVNFLISYILIEFFPNTSFMKTHRNTTRKSTNAFTKSGQWWNFSSRKKEVSRSSVNFMTSRRT